LLTWGAGPEAMNVWHEHRLQSRNCMAEPRDGRVGGQLLRYWTAFAVGWPATWSTAATMTEMGQGVRCASRVRELSGLLSIFVGLSIYNIGASLIDAPC
jgi:hypothetical protein